MKHLLTPDRTVDGVDVGHSHAATASTAQVTDSLGFFADQLGVTLDGIHHQQQQHHSAAAIQQQQAMRTCL